MHESYENSLWSTSATLKHKCGSFKRNSSVAPFSLFIFFLSFFYFFLFFCGLFGSFYLSLICPLWDLFMCPLLWSFVSSLGFFPHFKGNTLYITRMKKINTLLQGTHIKLNQHIMMFANVCLCQCSRICNGTSASCSNGVRAKPNYRVALQSSKSMYDNERSSHEKMDVEWQCISERLWRCLDR